MMGLPTPVRYLSEMSNHVQNHFGRTSFVLHEEKSATVQVDVHVVPPNADRPYFTLLTSGMSDLNMHVPEGLKEFELAEACLSPELLASSYRYVRVARSEILLANKNPASDSEIPSSAKHLALLGTYSGWCRSSATH